MKLFLICAALFCAKVTSQKTTYENYRVYTLMPKNMQEVSVLQQMAYPPLLYEVWRISTGPNIASDFVVPPHKLGQFQDILSRHPIENRLIIPNLQKLIDSTSPKKGKKKFGWKQFHNRTEINTWLDLIAKKYPAQVQIVVAGKSYEGRELKGVKLSFKEGNKAVFIEGGIHAREWISPAVITYIINEFLTSKNPFVQEIAQSYDWYFFPSINPDGFDYTHTTNRLWRLNRQPYGLCVGADPNRNWGYHWGEGGVVNQSCYPNFLGSAPFSEPEMKSLAEFITGIHESLVAYLAIHSYGQLLLLPYGYANSTLPDNYDELMELGEIAAKALETRYGTKYIVGNWAEKLYVSSGTSVDWVKGTFNVPITFTYELRQKDYGFVAPPSEIIPTAQEILDSIVVLISEVKARGYK